MIEATAFNDRHRLGSTDSDIHMLDQDRRWCRSPEVAPPSGVASNSLEAARQRLCVHAKPRSAGMWTCLTTFRPHRLHKDGRSRKRCRPSCEWAAMTSSTQVSQTELQENRLICSRGRRQASTFRLNAKARGTRDQMFQASDVPTPLGRPLQMRSISRTATARTDRHTSL